jgi:hypothetical protein
MPALNEINQIVHSSVLSFGHLVSRWLVAQEYVCIVRRDHQTREEDCCRRKWGFWVNAGVTESA